MKVIKGFPMKKILFTTGIVPLVFAFAAQADPQLDSWFTTRSAMYARIYSNSTAQAAGSAAATWSNGSQVQALPAYCGVQEIYSSSNWVYLRSTGLGSHVMGAWPAGFPNFPM